MTVGYSENGEEKKSDWMPAQKETPSTWKKSTLPGRPRKRKMRTVNTMSGIIDKNFNVTHGMEQNRGVSC